MLHRNPIILLLLCLALLACNGAEDPALSATPTLTSQMVQGKQLFSQYCASCHAVEPDTVIVGPSLFAVAERAAERAPDLTAQQYVERSILQPDAFLVPGYDNLMPSSLGKRLDGQELDAIVTYVLNLQAR